MNLTQQTLQGCIPDRFIVGPGQRVYQDTKLSSIQFVINLPLSEIGFVIRQNHLGTVFLQDKWQLKSCTKVRRLGREISLDKLREEIRREIKRSQLV